MVKIIFEEEEEEEEEGKEKVIIISIFRPEKRLSLPGLGSPKYALYIGDAQIFTWAFS